VRIRWYSICREHDIVNILSSQNLVIFIAEGVYALSVHTYSSEYWQEYETQKHITELGELYISNNRMALKTPRYMAMIDII
jgi:hypothetical protein